MQKNLSFSGYHNRPPQADDPLLTEVGPGTPGGEYLRRYWHRPHRQPQSRAPRHDDRGVVLFRRMLANAINAIRDGNTPALPRLYAGGTPVRTYAHETVLRLPTPDGLSDRPSLAAFGRRAASVFIEIDDVPWSGATKLPRRASGLS